MGFALVVGQSEVGDHGCCGTVAAGIGPTAFGRALLGRRAGGKWEAQEGNASWHSCFLSSAGERAPVTETNLENPPGGGTPKGMLVVQAF